MGKNTDWNKKRLKLEIFTPKYAKEVAELCNNENISKTTLGIPFPYTPQMADEWIARRMEKVKLGIELTFAITDKNSSKPTGCITLANINEKFSRAGVGYWLDEKEWNKGYATEALKAIIDFAFNKMGLHKVFCEFFAENKSSGRVMEKCGMVYEGTLKEHYTKNGEFKDSVCYGIINKN